jgi:hypothetical protein
MLQVYSTREIAERFSTDEWKVRRVFELNLVPEPGRFSGKRAIPESMVPQVVNALRQRGWLPLEQEAQQ